MSQQEYPCAEVCGHLLTTVDVVKDNVITVNVNGRAKPAHRRCPTPVPIEELPAPDQWDRHRARNPGHVAALRDGRIYCEVCSWHSYVQVKRKEPVSELLRPLWRPDPA